LPLIFTSNYQNGKNKNPLAPARGNKKLNKKPYFSPRSDVGYSGAGVLAFDDLAVNHSGAAASVLHRLALH